ncbi:FAD-dependent monooxygenase [Lichenifustis flavocetrariae]|uniref:FAD-dependent monooxygenase n=1 Tax=Lichenifustis flavocetrariae TaxID=2949735 RepID=A0AA41YUF1_9HYPH|nr:FAD-dependent monooxygenase [Lichenifustis flavocetrariae]MCW6507237.1 FAD-dependent monooxygenase [Lichenifustis flavocetrariae]
MAHVIVGGAGIGGLTAALAMSQAGSRVTLIERRQSFAEIGAGLQLGPNATRVLASLDLLEPVRSIATEPQTLRIRRGRDARDLIALPLGAGAEQRYGAPFLLVHRADLHRVLAEHARARPTIHIELGVAVLGVQQGRDDVTVVTDQASYSAEAWVDAGGLHAPDRLAASRRSARRTAWRALVPAAALPPSYARPETHLWLGHRTHLVHYPLRSAALINVVAITEHHGSGGDPNQDFWSQPGDAAELRHAFRGWHRDALRLLETHVDWRRWPLFDAEPLMSWSEGRATRLGDAAHPMLPFLAQGASQAIEDAGVLAWALSQPGGIVAALQAYDRRRAPRAARVQRASRRQGDIYHLPRPASDARDLVMRALGGQRALASMDWLYGPM